MGRPKNPEGKNKSKPSWTIPPDVVAELESASAITGVSCSQLVTMCCKQRIGSLVKILLSSSDMEPLKTVPMIATLKDVEKQKQDEAN